MFTVALPILIVPLFAGGFWNAVPGGVAMCAGELSAVLPTVAAGFPMMFTSALNPPFSCPANGCGSGTGGAGDGGTTMCVSTATIMSPCFAAGWPMASPRSVDVDGRAFDAERPAGLHVHAAASLDLRVG